MRSPGVRLRSRLILCLLCHGFLSAQDLPLRQSVRFERLPVEKGLSYGRVTTILQDREGWLWFGTSKGLNRFDGYQFKVWKNTTENPNILADNNIQCLFQDRKGMLWIGTAKGLSCYDQENNVFHNYLPSSMLPGRLETGNITAIVEDPKGNLWLGTNGEGIYRIPANQRDLGPDQVTFQHFEASTEPGSPSSSWIRSLYLDHSGTLWACTMRGLNKLVSDQGIFQVLMPIPDMPKNGKNHLFSIKEDKEGSLWLGSYEGILKYDRNTNMFQDFDDKLSNLDLEQPLHVNAIVEGHQGTMWFATFGNGLLAYSSDSERFEQYLPSRNDPDNIGSRRLLSLSIDNTGIIWIGTQSNGISMLNPDTFRFGYHRIDHLVQADESPEITAIIKDRKEQLWLGTTEGVFFFDENRRLKRRLLHNKNLPSSISHNWISCFLQDKKGHLWIGTSGGGLNRTSQASRGEPVFQHYRHDENKPDSLSHDSITCMHLDREERLWIGTAGVGLNLYDAAQETFTHYLHRPDHPGSLSHNVITAITQDQEGGLWVATNDGLNYLPAEGGQGFKHFHHIQNDMTSLDSEKILSLLAPRTGGLWVGTASGLNRLVNKQGRFSFLRYGERDGIPDGLFDILESEDGQLWISTARGLVRFDPERSESRIYGTHDGMQSNLTYGAAFKSHRNELFFGGKNGFNSFFSDTIRNSAANPPVYITDMQLFNESIVPNREGSPLTHPITKTKEIQLSYRDHIVSFEFSTLDYAVPERNRYGYKLDGLDENWRYTDGTKRYVTYTNLSPGDYVFRVKGSNRDGVWSSKEASLRIVVTPPFWATHWAYMVYILSLILVIAGYIRNEKLKLKRERQINERLDRMVAKRTRELEKSNQEILLQQQSLCEMDELKTRFFTNLSHEFRTPLTLTLGPLDDLLAQDHFGETTHRKLRGIHRNAHRLLGMINELLDVSKLEAGRMQLQVRERNLTAFVRECIDAFMPLAERKQVNLSARLPDTSLSIYFDADKLEKVLYNLLSNSFKHVPENGLIVVTLEKQEDRVAIIVKDNGPGIPPDRLPYIFDRFYQYSAGQSKSFPGTGIGLSLAQQLILLHGGDISVRSEFGFGCEFTITLRQGTDHLEAEQLQEANDSVENEETLSLNLIEEPVLEAKVDDDTTHQRHKTSVLVIEDNEEVRAYLCENLKNHHDVLQSPNGEKGLEIALEKVPDLIISDVMLPGINGLEVCRSLKQDERTSHIPIIILTAQATPEQNIEGLQIGADDYLTKPFNARVLMIRVENLIRSRQTLRELFSHKITATPSDVDTVSGEEVFLQKAIAIIEGNLSETGFGVNELAAELSFSRRQLHRKITAITGKTPFDLLRGIRLERAAQLLRQRADQISQIAYAVGFSKTQHFSNLFREAYGITPSEYAARHRN